MASTPPAQRSGSATPDPTSSGRAKSSFGRSLAVYLDRRMLVILLLGFSSGLPWALSFTTLSVWFTEVGVRKADIGLFVLVSLPYSWKFLWAPFLDRVPIPVLTRRLGQRRSWAMVAQAGLMASILWLGSLDPSRDLALMAWAALIVVFMSATQDIVIDAYRIEILSEDEQGAGSAMTTYGYRVGMLTSGAGALYLSDHMPWFSVYAIEASLLVIGVATVLVAREPRRTPAPSGAALSSDAAREGPGAVETAVEPVAPTSRESGGPARAGAVVSSGGDPGVAPGRGRLARYFRAILVDPFADFLHRPWWALILAFVVFYRFPDAFLGVMANVFYKDIGFTNTEIANVSKIFGFWATLGGVFLGGLVVHRFGVLRGLFFCGVFQMLSNLLYVWMAQRGSDLMAFTVTISIENVSNGMTGVAFVAYLSSLCSPGFAGSQYALLSALGTSTRNMFSAPSGWLAEVVGWPWFFVVSTVVAVPGMVLLGFFLLSGRFDRTPARERQSAAPA